MDREEQKLRKYLTGDLSEAEQVKIETEFLASDEAFERLEEIENDLVDEYVRGELMAQERSLFEKNYLTTPLHRQRVLLSQNLLRTAANEKMPAKNRAIASSNSWWAELFSGLKLHQLAWAVAALLIAVLSGWFLLRPQPATVINPEIAKAEATPPMDSPTPKPQPLKPETRIPKPETRIPTPVFLLRGAFNINQTRGTETKSAAAAKMQPLVLDKGVENVTLQMVLEGERYTKYQSEIRAIDTSKSFTLITKPPVKSSKNISLTIPAVRLAKADYILTLSGVTETGEVEEINQYPFRVTRK